jgi:hypothetical protein
MSVKSFWSRTATAVLAAVTAALVVSGPASAGPAVDDPATPVYVCTDLDAFAQSLRTAGFTSQAVKNYVELTRLDCNA